MYCPDDLNRMDENKTLEFLAELINDDGSPVICEYCDKPATEGLALYNPADALRDPPVTGIYSTLVRCDECRDNGVGEDETFYCEGCGEHFVVNHSWDVVAVMGEEGFMCQKCFAENMEGYPLDEVVSSIRNGESGLFKRLNSVPGKTKFFDGEFSSYSDFPGHTTWGGLANAILEAAEEADIDINGTVYPIIDHGYQFSVSLAIYH